MKKAKNFIKRNTKVVIAFILGLTIASSIGVYAATILDASDVSFSGSTTGLTSTNVQKAIDEVYTNALKEYECSTPRTTSDNGYFCGVYSKSCATSYGGGTCSSNATYYDIPNTRYNITILSTLDDISAFRFMRGASFITVPTSSVSSSIISKFNNVSTETCNSNFGTLTGINIYQCKNHSYYWKKL